MGPSKTQEADRQNPHPPPPRRKTRSGTRANDFSALLAVAETATQSLETEKILNETLDKSLEVLHFDVGYIRILDPETRNMVVRVARGLRSSQVKSNPVPIDSPHRHIANYIFETREPYISPDVRKDRRFHNRSMEREGVISAAYVPVMSKKRVIGTMALGKRKPIKFSNAKIQLLKAFGYQLGMALENAQLYDEVTKGKRYIENLVENAGDAIISTDTNDQILTWNRGAEVIFGYDKGEVVGKNLAVLLPPDRFHVLEEIRAKVQIYGVLRNIEGRGKRKDGRMVDLALSVSPVKDSQGKIIAFLRVAKDVTEEKRFEKRLKELDKMKSDFVSNVSHELRTPLTAIKGSADNMLDGLTGPLSEKQNRYLVRIKSNADRLSRLINDILDLSKIEAGRIELKPIHLPLFTLIQEVVESLRPVAAEKLLNIETGALDAATTAWADRDKTTQVLINLIGNAVKFTPPKGKVTVGVKQADDEWVQVSVADTGPGIELKEANQIFDKFYQIAEAKNQKTKGTGLGLAISKALVEMHGGRIWVESVPGAGCTFQFTLPRKQPFKLEAPVRSEGEYGTQSPGR